MCVSVCVKVKCFDISAQIATKLHTRIQKLPGKVLKPISISWTYRKIQFWKAYMGR